MTNLRSLRGALRRLGYALLPLLGWLALRLQELRATLARLLFGRLRIETHELAEATILLLVEGSRAIPLGERRVHPEVVTGLAGGDLRARGMRLHELLGTEGCLFFYGPGFPVPVFVRVEDDYTSVDHFGSLALTYPRGWLDADRLLEAAAARALAEAARRAAGEEALEIRVVSASPYRESYAAGPRRFGAEGETAPCLATRFVGDPALAAMPPPRRGPAGPRLEDMVLPPEQEACLRDLEDWIASRSWYLEHRVPWRRGYLFHGPPGTGKTSFALALARRFGLEVLEFDLASLDNRSLRAQWRLHTAEGAKLALFEDFDVLFRGRKTRRRARDYGALTFDCVLSILDGTCGGEGCVTVITTNKPEHLDPAIAATRRGATTGRPGRVDLVVPFGYLDGPRKRALAARLLGGYPALAERLASGKDRPTVAAFQERCIQALLDLRAGPPASPGNPGSRCREAPPEPGTPRAIR